MNFDKLAGEVGFGLAVVVFADKLNSGFFGKLTFGQLLDVYRAAIIGSELRTSILGMMWRKADTFENRCLLYYHAPLGNGLVDRVLDKIKNSVQTISLEQWRWAYRLNVDRSDKWALHNLAINKILELSTTLKDWQLAGFDSFHNDKLNTTAIGKMSELAATFDELWSVVVNSASESESRDTAIDKLKLVGCTFKEVSCAWDDAPSDSELRGMLLTKASELANTFGEWYWIQRRLPEGNEISSTVIAKMAEKANTFKKLQVVYMCASVDNDLKSTTLKKMAELANTIEERYLVYSIAATDSDLGTDMFAKISTTVATFEDWEQIYNRFFGGVLTEYFGNKLYVLIIAKMLEQARSLQQVCRVYSIAPPSNGLRTSALAKARSFI